jgi:hypothetical protein
MGALTVPNGVWYPDLTDVGQPNVWASTMAQSIDTSIGVRLQKQELTQSLVANLAANQSFVNNTGQSVNFTINAGVGFNNGMTIGGGRITITQAGLYFFSANVLGTSTSLASQGFLQTQIRKNTNVVFANGITNLSSNGTSNVATTSMSGVMQCVANDVIDVFANFQGSTAGTLSLSAGGGLYNILSAALLKAS